MAIGTAADLLQVTRPAERGIPVKQFLNPSAAVLLAGAAGAATMIVELVAGRILVPYLGTSLYTWTSIIGVVLAGVSVGYACGGWLADRARSRQTLGFVFVAGGLACLAVPVMTKIITDTDAFGALPLVPRIVLVTAVIFLAPSSLLGAVLPLVVRLTLTDLALAGSTVGLIYAASALGSIAGTFLTGLVLIERFGTRPTLVALSALLVALGMAVGAWWRTRRGALTTFVALGTYVLVVVALQGKVDAPCIRETSYSCLRVVETTAEGRPVRALLLDRLVHSYNDPDDPRFLTYGYTQMIAEAVAFTARGRDDRAFLFLGGGGYTLPRYILATYARAQADVAEIDPGVTAVAREQLGLRDDPRLGVYHQDARLFLSERRIQAQYDVVVGDVFNDLGIPFHLTTVEFARSVRRALKSDGVYIVNVVDDFQRGAFLRAMVATLRAVWPHVYVLSRGGLYLGSDPTTYVLLASNQPVDRTAFAWQTSVAYMLDEPTVTEYLSRGRQLVLTDDYVPAENLVAPLFFRRAN